MHERGAMARRIRKARLGDFVTTRLHEYPWRRKHKDNARGHEQALAAAQKPFKEMQRRIKLQVQASGDP
jgi:hypothetical protein